MHVSRRAGHYDNKRRVVGQVTPLIAANARPLDTRGASRWTSRMPVRESSQLVSSPPFILVRESDSVPLHPLMTFKNDLALTGPVGYRAIIVLVPCRTQSSRISHLLEEPTIPLSPHLQLSRSSGRAVDDKKRNIFCSTPTNSPASTHPRPAVSRV